MKEPILTDRIERKIYLIRGQKVMIDSHLASLYAIETKSLLRAVKRNRMRFPCDFAFQLNRSESLNLRCQIGTSSSWGGRRYLPYVFTEQGVAMLSSVLNSPRAIRVNIAIMRVFVRLREILSAHKELAHKLQTLETRIDKHDQQIQSVFDAINQLISPPEKPKRHIGFHVEP